MRDYFPQRSNALINFRLMMQSRLRYGPPCRRGGIMTDTIIDTHRIVRAGLAVATPLVRFIEECALPGTGIEPAAFWAGVAGLFARFAPENAILLAKRDDLQARID